ncbi:MAG: hypothetical protein M3N54_13520 [Acidobacteriota bacterium]|nr:hypothetical protein [Acidobacteriota bacterium]
MHRALLLVMILILSGTLSGETVSGTILIKRKLTKRSVTAAVAIYQRGPAVELAKDAAEDPLAFERSRVAIWIEGPGPSTPLPAGRDSASMQQSGRRFQPDMVVLAAGGTVAFPNMDVIFHNVFSLSGPRMFDLGNYTKGASRSVTFPKPGIVYVNCHLHPNMAGVVVVTPNRWNAQSDGAGQFELRYVPPGVYTVVAWHKAAGYFRKTLQISPGSNPAIEFFIPLGALEPVSAALGR